MRGGGNKGKDIINIDFSRETSEKLRNKFINREREKEKRFENVFKEECGKYRVIKE